jgi:hypothetical protein
MSDSETDTRESPSRFRARPNPFFTSTAPCTQIGVTSSRRRSSRCGPSSTIHRRFHSRSEKPWKCGQFRARKMRQFRSARPCQDGPGALDWLLHRARSASRSKPLPRALGGSRRFTGEVDESATGSVNFFWSYSGSRQAAISVPAGAPGSVLPMPPASRAEQHVDSRRRAGAPRPRDGRRGQKRIAGPPRSPHSRTLRAVLPIRTRGTGRAYRPNCAFLPAEPLAQARRSL